MQYMMQSFNTAGKAAVVLAINLSFFLVIPISQNFFKLFEEQTRDLWQQQRIVAEYVKPKRKEVKEETKSRIRSISNESSEPLQSSMKFKFTPDLGVGGAGDGVALDGRDLEGEVFEEGQVDVDVSPVYTPMPPYARRARDLAVEGVATATFVVGVDGRVKVIENVDAPHPSMVPEIRTTLLNWRFNPAQNKGVPVRKRVNQPFDFRLN